MTTTGPYTQSLNRTHMFSFVDYRGKSEIVNCPAGNSIINRIANNPQLTKFKKIIDCAGFGAQLAEKQANFTLFVPLDKYINEPDHFFDNMDNGFARQIIASSMMNNQIDSSLLKSSPVSYYTTRNPRMRMYITNIRGETRINEIANIVAFDIKTDNGIIHLIDNMILPSTAIFQ